MTASTTTGWAEGKLGARVRPDILLSEVKAVEIDLLVFVSGGGAEQYFDDPVAHGLAKASVAAGKPVAAICIAPLILACAGLLGWKRATVYVDGACELEKVGAVYTGKPV